ncbi:hypothetical protein RZS28_04695 [Methylocapsa polymorpha]|uniref:Uncharacterized protein n=1 Tax=Methylocapsa polymorpha TaxID=3080828 RepID=A0ABZ0HUJ6_9HYPH|nr:hypothetical protein RZS28_04695 [Methylocapsa sp. RX1]
MRDKYRLSWTEKRNLFSSLAESLRDSFAGLFGGVDWAGLEIQLSMHIGSIAWRPFDAP